MTLTKEGAEGTPEDRDTKAIEMGRLFAENQWIVTVIATEIGLLTPPLGIAVYVVHATLARPDISLKDVFVGSAPFALAMLFVLCLVIAFPPIATFLVHL